MGEVELTPAGVVKAALNEGNRAAVILSRTGELVIGIVERITNGENPGGNPGRGSGRHSASAAAWICEVLGKIRRVALGEPPVVVEGDPFAGRVGGHESSILRNGQ